MFVPAVPKYRENLLGNITLAEDQLAAGKARRESVLEKMNGRYWSSNPDLPRPAAL